MKNIENFYRIYLSSLQSLENTTALETDFLWNYCSFNISLPTVDFTPNDLEWFICVETFCMSQTPTSSYLVTSPTLSFPNNYSALTGGSQSILLLSNQSSYHNFVYNDIMGNKIGTPHIFNNTIFRIEILEADEGSLLSKPNDAEPLFWEMTLIVYSKKKNIN
jgi:hypothetical protein